MESKNDVNEQKLLINLSYINAYALLISDKKTWKQNYVKCTGTKNSNWNQYLFINYVYVMK